MIICAHNAEKYIGRTLRSCYDQSFDKLNYEIIVVNDGSTDRTLKALAPYQSFYADKLPIMRVVKLKHNQGIACAANEGIRAAIGQFVVRVDADDYMSEKLLEIEHLCLTTNKEYGAVACDYLEVDEFENVISRHNVTHAPIACGVMFRKDRLEEIGLYDPEFRLREDKDLLVRFLTKFNIMRIPIPLYRYRKHDKECTNSPQIKEYEKLFLDKYAP